MGGAFSAFPSTLNVGVDDPNYFGCETIVHLKPSYLEGPVLVISLIPVD